MKKLTIIFIAFVCLIAGLYLGFRSQSLNKPTPLNQTLKTCPEIVQPKAEELMTFANPSWPDLTFQYPKNWAQCGFANFSEAGLDLNSDRIFSVNKITLQKNQTLQQYLDQKLKECIKSAPASQEFGQPICDFQYKIDISKLKTMDINGHTAYLVGELAVPESGELQNRVYLQINEGYFLIVYTTRGVVNGDIFNQVLRTIKIKS